MNSHHHRILAFLLILFTGSVSAQTYTAEMLSFIRSKAVSPQAYVIEKFKTHDVILLGEHHLVKQNLQFVTQLIPELYRNGVYAIGMEFGAQEDQQKLDSLVLAPTYDEQTAREIMFHYNVTWGYEEYIDVYKAAWKFNHTLPANARKFRILNLSYVFQWKGFDGNRNQESMARVFPKGTIDKFRAQVIEREILKSDDKILALVGTPHAYTRYGSPYYSFNGDGFCGFDKSWLGNRLYGRHTDKVFSILLHQPFIKEVDGQYRWVSPAMGSIEAIMAQNQHKQVGFDLVRNPLGGLKDDSQHAKCYPDFTLDQFFDGYIFLAPLKKLEGCTPIDGFVNEQNIQHALEQFPDSDWHEPVTNLEEMRAFIRMNGKRIEEECKNL
jgi:uncharacterized iron-regulated protein